MNISIAPEKNSSCFLPGTEVIAFVVNTEGKLGDAQGAKEDSNRILALRSRGAEPYQVTNTKASLEEIPGYNK